MHRTLGTFVAVVTTLNLACGLETTGPSDVPTGSRVQSLAHSGAWQLPAKVKAAGNAHPEIDYVGAGPWIGEDGCSGALEPGAAELRDYLYDWFPQTDTIWGYNCRKIVGGSSMSVHGTGRALDIMIPLAGDYSDDNAADNDLGDPIGNWLVEHADDIGIQFIIWDQWTWGPHRAAGARERAYGGAHPHHDHLHIELTPEAAAGLTPFFDGAVPDPQVSRCGAIPAEGAVIDDVDPCVLLYGKSSLWREEEGNGYGGSLRWTNAYSSATESNWARYALDFEAGGDYEVQVYLDPARSVHRETRYAVTHADGITEVILDQSANEGWTALGTFRFEDGGKQDVMVFDNSDGPVGEDQHIALDAIQLVGMGDRTAPGPNESDSPDDHELASSGLTGGCAAGGSSGGSLAGLLLVALVAVRRRRR